MTWSPFFTVVTPAPTSTTMPAPSWPRMAGKSPSGSAPERVNSSVWQMPVALISTSTSPAFGPASCTFSMASGLPASHATAARTSIASSSVAARQHAGVKAEMAFHERLDEEIAVVVALVAAQLERLAGLAARFLEQLRLQLLLEKRVRETLVDQDSHAERPAREQLGGVVLAPSAAIGAEIAAERLLAPGAAARRRDRRERRERA